MCDCWKGVHGCRGCMVAGSAWLPGVHGCRGVHGCQGDMNGCWGACVVAGGMHGCQGVHGCQGACMVAGGVCHCWGHAWLQGACMVAWGHAWLLGGVHRARRDTVNERAVHILLECILVLYFIF